MSHLTKFSCFHYASGKKDSVLNLMGRLLEILCAFTTLNCIHWTSKCPLHHLYHFLPCEESLLYVLLSIISLHQARKFHPFLCYSLKRAYIVQYRGI